MIYTNLTSCKICLNKFTRNANILFVNFAFIFPFSTRANVDFLKVINFPTRQSPLAVSVNKYHKEGIFKHSSELKQVLGLSQTLNM